MKKIQHRLGAVQMQIMNVLWEMGQATAREITERLSQGREVAHSTVQTLLRELEAKGAVTHESDARTFVFRPVFQKEDVKETATRELIARLFDGSASSLVAHLLEQERLTPEELARIRQMIAEEAPNDTHSR